MAGIGQGIQTQEHELGVSDESSLALVSLEREIGEEGLERESDERKKTMERCEGRKLFSSFEDVVLGSFKSSF